MKILKSSMYTLEDITSDQMVLLESALELYDETIDLGIVMRDELKAMLDSFSKS